MPAFQHGDLVWYLQTCRGGYGFQRKVPAVFLHATPQRSLIEVTLMDGKKRVIAVKAITPRLPEERIERY
ncbi:MAG TPA: hypothetical protein VMR92_08530 [Gemmatimonadales bacterium]|nr:hypothetical protein [Gemmatimonadales bacterium]